MGFRNQSIDFERVEGWSKGQPEVFVAPAVLEFLGAPSVDYDSLERLFVDDLLIPDDFNVEIRLEEGFDGYGEYNRRTPHLIRVDAIGAEEDLGNEGGTMLVVTHEGRHMSDWIHLRNMIRLTESARFAGSVGLGLLGYKLSLEVLPSSVTPGNGAGLPLLVGASTLLASQLSMRALWNWDEERAQMQELAPATFRHLGDITFPNYSPRPES